MLARRSLAAVGAVLCFLVYFLYPLVLIGERHPLDREEEFEGLEDLIFNANKSTIEIGACIPILNEGKWLDEWLVHHRLAGVEKFWLYDTGSIDNTEEVLEPWISAGIVELHQFEEEQGCNHQHAALEHCAHFYGPQTDWLMIFDIDEFFFLSADIASMSESPFLRDLLQSKPYSGADAVVFSRVNWLNEGNVDLESGTSLFQNQTLRKSRAAINQEDTYTKSILHTSYGSTLVKAAYPHDVEVFEKAKSSILDASGKEVDEGLTRTESYLKYRGDKETILWEPAAIYHYLQRDQRDCEIKAKTSGEICRENWRSRASPDFCRKGNLFVEKNKPLSFTRHTRDRSVSDSRHASRVKQGMDLALRRRSHRSIQSSIKTAVYPLT